MLLKGLLMFCVFAVFANALDNGLARTPPMGWLSWERFRCNTDCKNDPDNCISEKLFTDMADRMAAEGYREAGYEYVIIDDCWLAKERDVKGRLQADPERFPHGIKWLADYIHSKGLKFGIYGDFGTLTCGGYPGNEYYLQTDAQTYADWGVDYFKMDGCNSELDQYDDAYPAMGFWLNMTGRPIVYSCSWPAYQEGSKIKVNYEKIAKTCNLWRNYDDIQDSWASVKSILAFYGNNNHTFQQYAAPGSFNDPDMLLIGNFGLSKEQQKSQMALWSIMASPLIMSNDLRNIDPFAKSILLNASAIAINQDPLGIQGRLVMKKGEIEIWTKPILPKGDMAFVILNLGEATPTKVHFKLSDIGLVNPLGYKMFEVFQNVPLPDKYIPSSSFSVTVNPSGVFFGRAKRMW